MTGYDQSATAPARVVLVSGMVVMLALLPAVRHAALICGRKTPTVLLTTLTAEAFICLIMLLGEVRHRQKRIEERFAASMVRAIRWPGWQ